ncbi:MAG: hypothetical protein AAFY98_03645 [Verrucomicrobiota bacterium]
MPFPASKVLEKIQQARSEDRLAHAYLLSGLEPESLESLALKMAESMLDGAPTEHPDCHIIRPESKSRRITIAQIRALEHDLRLKAYQAENKVALILAADRMCAGSAEPANAFLKTLEEPPSHCQLILTTDRPDQILATIRSRCLVLPIQGGSSAPLNDHHDFVESWITSSGQSIERAYRRAALTIQYWRELKNEALKNEKQASGQDLDPAALDARAESQFQLERDQSIAALIRSIWKRSDEKSSLRASQICSALEDLRYAISRNIEVSLAVEKCHIQMEMR